MSIEASWPEVPKNDADKNAYITAQIGAIAGGDVVWVQRNFHSNTHKILDLFFEGKHRGFIEHDSHRGNDEEDLQCWAYIDMGRGESPERAVERDLSLDEASRVLLEEILPTKQS